MNCRFDCAIIIYDKFLKGSFHFAKVVNNKMNNSSLSPAELSKRRNMLKRKAALKKAQRRLVLIISAILFFVLLLVIFIIFRADLSAFVSVKKPENVYIVYSDEKTEQVSTKYLLLNGETSCISLKFIADKLLFTISGDSKQKTLNAVSSSDMNQYAEFSAGSEIVNIGGVPHYLGTSVLKKNDDFYIPLTFFNEYVNGASYLYNQEKSRNELTLPVQKDGKENSPVTFILSNESATKKASVNGKTESVMPEQNTPSSVDSIKYNTDVSEYLQYIEPENPEEYIKLISTKSTLPKDYSPTDLTDVIFTRKDGRPTQRLRKAAAMALEAMLKEAASEGYDDISVTSAFRDYNYQKQLFDNEVSSFKARYGDKAEEEAAKNVAIPGTSEHQSGLCVDMHNLPSASETFSETDAYKWLYANCAKFGFILRFPNGKEDITGIVYEPWHYRFVGRTHAMKIMSQGLCLEEYLEKLEETKNENE